MAGLGAKSFNFQGVVFIPNTEITASGFNIERKKTNQCLVGLRMEGQGVQSPQTFLVKNFLFLQLLRKHDQSAFKYVLNTDHTFKAAFWT